MHPHAEGLLEATTGGRPVRWAATGRSGGVSRPPFEALNLAAHVGDDVDDVAANRALVARHLDVAPTAVAVLTAEHGARVVFADSGGALPPADAAVTTREGLALLALGADCATIALADADAGVVGVAHCGWRGLVAGVVPAVVDAMRSAGAHRLAAVIGPAICPRCYPVGAECIEQIVAAVSPEVAEVACLEVSGQWFVDVPGAARVLLQSAGVAVTSLPGCTVEDADLFSHRRDGRTGRHGMIVVR